VGTAYGCELYFVDEGLFGGGREWKPKTRVWCARSSWKSPVPPRWNEGFFSRKILSSGSREVRVSMEARWDVMMGRSSKIEPKLPTAQTEENRNENDCMNY
jgi:hypothetical protein